MYFVSEFELPQELFSLEEWTIIENASLSGILLRILFYQEYSSSMLCLDILNVSELVE